MKVYTTLLFASSSSLILLSCVCYIPLYFFLSLPTTNFSGSTFDIYLCLLQLLQLSSTHPSSTGTLRQVNFLLYTQHPNSTQQRNGSSVSDESAHLSAEGARGSRKSRSVSHAPLDLQAFLWVPFLILSYSRLTLCVKKKGWWYLDGVDVLAVLELSIPR